MPKFSNASLDQLATCDQRLQLVFNEVIKHVDCKVLAGHRGELAQTEAYMNGNSTKLWPYSMHNKVPSLAVDVVPYPIDWGNTGTPAQRASAIARFRMFSGFVLGVASQHKISLKSGGDWDMDFDLGDQVFIDLPHFELVGAE